MSTNLYSLELNSDICTPYDNAQLTITLKLGFRQVNPADGAVEGTYHDYGNPKRTSRKIVSWTQGGWDAWKKNFISSAENYWNGKLWLVSNFSILDFDHKGICYRPNVWCRLDLQGGDADKGTYNFIIDVVHLHKSEKFFGSNARLYDNLDVQSVQKDKDSKGQPIMQQAHVHEVGHLLGLGHVDIGKPHCMPSGDTNRKPCYGMTDADKNSVMGAGMQLRPEHAMPWRKAMKTLTKKGNPLDPKDWAAKLQRHYPRTLAEAKANLAITAKPMRG